MSETPLDVERLALAIQEPLSPEPVLQGHGPRGNEGYCYCGAYVGVLAAKWAQHRLDTKPVSPDLRAAILALHRDTTVINSDGDERGGCAECEVPYPCPTADLALVQPSPEPDLRAALTFERPV